MGRLLSDLPFEERVERPWRWAESPPQGSGGLGPVDEHMEFAHFNDYFPEYSRMNLGLRLGPRCTQFTLWPRTTWGCSYPGNPKGETPLPPRRCEPPRVHPASNGRRGRPDFDASGSHARDMAPSTSSRAYGSRAIPPRSTAFIR